MLKSNGKNGALLYSSYTSKKSRPTKTWSSISTEEGFWYGEDSETGYVEFFAWDGGQQDGYGGRHYEIELEDGTSQVLKGPWSSRAGVANKLGYGPCMKALYRTHPDQLGGKSGHITVDRAEEIIDDLVDEEVELSYVECFDDAEPYYVPIKPDQDSATGDSSE